MSDNELDELLLQLKIVCKKNRSSASNETNFNNILKKIDVFINRRQMKLLNHQKRLEDLQRDLLLSESESSRNRLALEKKDFEVNQLHSMLNKAEQTTQTIMTKYDNDVQKLTKQLDYIQQEYERLRTTNKNNRENKSLNELLTEIAYLRELNKVLENDNQRLYHENDQLKQMHQHEKTINSFQLSNQQRSVQIDYESKMKTLENDINFYKHRLEQQEMEINRLTKERTTESKQHRTDIDILNTAEIDRLHRLLTISEQQCNSLRLELQRIQTDKEILKVRLLEQNMIESPTTAPQDIDKNDYEKFIRNELEINIDQANRLINYWNSHKQTLEEKIRQLTNEINQLKTTNNFKDFSLEIHQYNETILQAKREISTLKMDITDKNTTIYNLYKKIECLEQALTISKQRMNAQLNEIEELRSNKSKSLPVRIDGFSTDDECQIRKSIEYNRNLCTSSPIKSTDIQKYFHHCNSESLMLPSDRRNILSN